MEKVLFKQKKILKDYFQLKVGINFIFRLYIMEENFVKQEIVTELLVKFVKAVIQIEKSQLKPKKRK